VEYKNGSHITPEHLELLNLLGKEKVEEVIKIMGARKFTLKPLLYHIKCFEIKKAIETTNKTFEEIARENSVSTKTIQRIIKLKNKI